MTSHAESRGRLRRLVGRREKLAAIYVVFRFKVVRINNCGDVVFCCVVY